MTSVSLSDSWHAAAVDRWYDAQDHVGQADTDPEPYVETAADAAVRVVLAHLSEKIRQVWISDVDALDAEERGERSLTERERALLDAFLTGTGYLVSGRRVDPVTVVVFRGPESPSRGQSER